MGIKCLFGKHDWEDVFVINEFALLTGLQSKKKYTRIIPRIKRARELELKWSEGPFTCTSGRVLRQRVCLKCCKTVDEISNYVKNIDFEIQRDNAEWLKKERRRVKAKEMSRTCASGRFYDTSTL